MKMLLEFFLVTGKILWWCLVAMIKHFNPFTSKKNIEGDVVLVTGSGSGIGRLMALRFAKLGAKVVLWDINREANEAVAKEIKEMGKTAHALVCDCSKKEEIYRVAEKVKREIGEVTVLVNNAGIVSGKKLFDVPDKLVDLTFQVNTMAHFWTLKAFVPAMIARNKGHIITVSSSAGLFGVAGLVDYCGSKFGAVGIHESIAAELHTVGADGVKTTLVCPYFIDTGMFEGVKGSRTPWLLPSLKPDYAVEKIMQAFHSDQAVLMMPRSVYFFYILQGLLPKSATWLAAKYTGADTFMDTFVGRQKKE